MSSSRQRPVEGRSRGGLGRTGARHHPQPRLARPRRGPWRARRTPRRRGRRGRPRPPALPRRGGARRARPAAQQWTTVVADPAASSTHSSACGRGRCVHRAVPVEAGGGRDPPGHHEGQRRLVDLQDERGAGDAPLHVGEVVAPPLRRAPGRGRVGHRSRRAPCRRAASRPSRPSSTGRRPAPSAARRTPGSAPPAVSRSWPSSDRARRWSTPGGVGEPPPGRLQVEAEVGHAPRPCGRSCPAIAPRAGSSGRCGQVRQLAEHHPRRLGEVLPRHRADARGARRAHAVAAVRRVAEIVADPTTRVPS